MVFIKIAKQLQNLSIIIKDLRADARYLSHLVVYFPHCMNKHLVLWTQLQTGYYIMFYF